MRNANSQLARSVAHDLIETGSLKIRRDDPERNPSYLADRRFLLAEDESG